MSQLWQRREHRVDYESMIRLFPPQQSDPIEGRTANLSQSGVFVSAPALCEVGTELLCDLELPQAADQARLTLHGRVAWVYEPHDGSGGMGIEFVGVSEPDATALRDLAGPTREEVRQLDVWFDGVEQPVRVEALPGSQGVKLRTSLPFLQLGSGVSFGSNDLGPASGRGQLHAVELMLDPTRSVPFLELTVAPDPSPAPQGEAPRGIGPIIPGKTADAFGSEVSDQRSAVAVGDGEDTLRISRSAEEGHDGAPAEGEKLPADQPGEQLGPECAPLARELEARTDEVLDDDVLGDEVLGDAVQADDAADQDDGDWQDDDDEQWEAEESREAAQLELDLARERMASSMSGQADRIDFAAEQLPEEISESSLLAAEDIDQVESLDPGDASEQQLAASMVETTRRPQTWLWLTGLALCVTTLAWTIHAGYWARVNEPDAPGPVASAEGQPNSAEASALAGDADQASERSAQNPPNPVAAQAGDLTDTPAKSATEPDSPAPSLDEPRLQRFGEATVVTVPIRGSTAGVQHYQMTRPPGLVVKLPGAKARLPHHDYRINAGGFGVVWVRRGDDGLHLRFHFTAKRLQHTLTLGEDRVAVTLSPEA